MRRLTAIRLFGISCLLVARLDAATTVISGARVITGGGAIHEGGTVVIADGKIRDVLPEGRLPQGVPADARRIDGAGKVLTAAIFDADSTVGIEEISLVPATVDVDEEAGPVMPQLRTVDAYNPLSEVVGVARAGGVLLAAVTPGGGNVFAGRSFVARLDARLTADRAALLEPAALHVNLGVGPKAKFGGRNESPSTRMGTAAVVREAFVKASDYRKKLQAYERKKAAGAKGKEAEPPEHDPRSEALLPALDGKLPVVFRAHRADDIETALRLRSELSLRAILLGGGEAFKVAPRLASAKVPVIYSPPLQQPDSMERLSAVEDAPERLHRAGVLLALGSSDGHNGRNLPIWAGRATAFGLPRDAALAAITINPARIFGLQDRIGTIEPGKEAHLVLWSGDPLEATTLPVTIISGDSVDEPISMLDLNARPYLRK